MFAIAIAVVVDLVFIIIFTSATILPYSRDYGLPPLSSISAAKKSLSASFD